MKPETRIALVRQLEAIKVFEQRNHPSRMSYFGWWGEVVLGAWLMGWNVVNPARQVPWAALVFFFLGLGLLVQGALLIFRHHLDRRYRLLLEAILSIQDPIGEPEPAVPEEPKRRRTRAPRRVKRRR